MFIESGKYRKIYVHDPRVEEIASRKVLNDEFPETMQEGVFMADRNFDTEETYFDLNEDEIRIFLGLLRTSDVEIEKVEQLDGISRYEISFYDDKAEDMDVLLTDNGDLYIERDDEDGFENVSCDELKEYYYELAKRHRGDTSRSGCHVLFAGSKPVVYLYGYNEPVNVKVDLDSHTEFTTTYPKYTSSGWNVEARPDGHLMDRDGKQYRYLYWEAETSDTFDFSTGFCVKGEETSEFLENTLPKLGLNSDEINEFIIYWLPRMEKNPYNVISFQQEKYEEMAQLKVTPKPDRMIRVFMAWYGTDEPEQNLTEQEIDDLSEIIRSGRTVVEWGGTEVTRNSVETVVR